MSSNESITRAAEIAQFRFGLIAPVIQGLFPDASRTAFYKRITENPIVFPDGIARELSYKTLEKWVSNYQREGIDALMPSERSDKGTTRVLPDTAIEEIYRLKQAFPVLMPRRSTPSLSGMALFRKQSASVPYNALSGTMT